MAKKKSRAEMTAELRMLRAHGIGNHIANLVRTLVKYGVLAFIALQVQIAVTNLSGKTTHADIRVDTRGSIRDSKMEQAAPEASTVPLWFGGLGVFVGICGVGYGRMQRRLRQQTVEQMHPYHERYEKLIDARRTSSSLTRTGETRPEDR